VLKACPPCAGMRHPLTRWCVAYDIGRLCARRARRRRRTPTTTSLMTTGRCRETRALVGSSTSFASPRKVGSYTRCHLHNKKKSICTSGVVINLNATKHRSVGWLVRRCDAGSIRFASRCQYGLARPGQLCCLHGHVAAAGQTFGLRVAHA